MGEKGFLEDGVLSAESGGWGSILPLRSPLSVLGTSLPSSSFRFLAGSCVPKAQGPLTCWWAPSPSGELWGAAAPRMQGGAR